METEECEICGKEIKGSFTWVRCSFFNFHPVEECGGCVYPVGNTCIKKVSKEFHGEKDTVENWNKRVEKMRKERGG